VQSFGIVSAGTYRGQHPFINFGLPTVWLCFPQGQVYFYSVFNYLSCAHSLAVFYFIPKAFFFHFISFEVMNYLLIKVHTSVEVDVPLNISLFPSTPKTDTHTHRPSCASSVCQHVPRYCWSVLVIHQNEQPLYSSADSLHYLESRTKQSFLL
jgi:hypothetical protein